MSNQLHKKRNNQIAYLLAVGTLTGMCSQAWGAGFQLIDQSVSCLRTAYSGTAASAIDASIGYYNSAGLTLLGEEQISVSLIGVAPHTRVHASRATPTIAATALPPGGAFAFAPSAGPISNIAPGHGRSRAPAVIPSVHYALRLSDCLVFGMNLTTPFGLNTKYKNNSITRYLSTRGTVRTYDISPSLAYAFNDNVSLGAGVDFLYTIAQFDNRVGFGIVSRDGLFENTVDRWSVGGHVGLLVQFNDCTRFGIQYRSGFNVKGKGDSRKENPIFTSRFISLAPPITQGIRAKLRLPSSTVFSGYHDINECWAWMFDIQYTEWKRFNKIVANFEDNTRLVQRFDFKSTWRYALGTTYQFSDCWLGSLGVAYDKSPVTHPHKRTTLIPDSDRTWVALGAQYRIFDCLAIDVGYAHLFFKKSDIRQGPPFYTGTPTPRQSIVGRYNLMLIC